MEDIFVATVPLIADYGTAQNWLEAHEWKIYIYTEKVQSMFVLCTFLYLFKYFYIICMG